MRFSPISKSATTLALAASVSLSLLPCAVQTSRAEPPANNSAATPATVSGSVHSINLERPDNVAMPPGPHQEAYNNNCVLCHTSRYVLMQPKFPRKTWEAEVSKMVKIYGAPIAEDQQKDIVDYLVSIRGREETPAAPAPPSRDAAMKDQKK